MNYFFVLYSAFALFASVISTHHFAFRPQDFSDAEIAIIELPPPISAKRDISNGATSANLQEAPTTDQKDSADGQDEPSKPFTFAFPISGRLSNGQFGQSFIIPLPTNIEDKTGIIVIEDHRSARNADQKTLRAQIFTPNRITKIQTTNTNSKNKNDQLSNRINVQPRDNAQTTTPSALRLQLKQATTTESFAQPSTLTSVKFDDDLLAPTRTTFSPELVFRPTSTPAPKRKKQIQSVILGLQPLRNDDKLESFSLQQPGTSRRSRRPPTTSTQPTTEFVEIIDDTDLPVTVPPTTEPPTTTAAPTTRNLRRRVPQRQNFRRISNNNLQKLSAQTTTLKPFTTTLFATTNQPVEVETMEELSTTSAKPSIRNQKSFSVQPKQVSPNSNITKPRPPSTPHIPGNFGFLPSGKAFNLPRNVPGKAGEDYPVYDRIPITNFDCREQIYPGFYADLEAGCQVYHSCNGGLRGSKHTFLCPNGTIFSQEYLICDWWYNVKCDESPRYYPLNKDAFAAEPKKVKKLIVTTNTNTGDKNKQTTTEFVMRTVTTTGIP